MRKVTGRIQAAFQKHKALTVANTSTDGQSVFLHGNKIIERRADGVYFTLAGWGTSTTRERVNGIAGAGVYQEDFSQMRDGAAIDSRDWYKV